LNFSASSPALSGEYAAIESGNDRLFSFVRWADDDQLIVVSNFDDAKPYDFTIDVPADIISEWNLADGRYALDEQLYGENDGNLVVDGGKGYFTAKLAPLESVVLKVGGMQIVRHSNFPSKFVASRPIDVWLPAGYRDSDKPFRVLYAHDGQNLFNPEWSPYSKTDWAIDEVLQKLIDDGEVENTIVVGIGNTESRFDEYLPWEMYQEGSSDYRARINEYMVGDEPTSREYLQFIVEELKPFIDSQYRTRTGRDDTFLLGSSLGGLISLYGVTRYPEVFGGAACVSTAWPSTFTADDPAANTASIDFLHDAMPAPGNHKFYFDFGSEEFDLEFEPHQRVIDNLMRELGYEFGELWQTHEFEGAEHSETYWRKRVHIPLKFLLAPAKRHQH
jgi:enterochelin esterase-like enzyme